MKKLSKGSRFAILSLVLIACIAVGFGVYDLATKGSAPGVFPFAGIMLGIALLTFLLSKRTDGRATVLALLLLGAAAGSCQRPTLEARAERMQPDVAVHTYTDAQGFEVVVVDTVQHGW